MRKSVRTVSGCRGDGGSPGNSGTNLRSDHADTNRDVCRRCDCDANAFSNSSAEPHSHADLHAESHCNADSRADAPVSAGYASGTHGQHLVALEL